MKAPLSARLFLTHAAVALVGTLAAYLTVRLLAPPLFDQRMMMGAAMRGAFGGPGSVHAAFVSALDTALIVGALASLVTAALAAMLVTRRLLRPLNAVRTATRRIAAGRYTGTVPLPAEPELAALAADVNTLGKALADTESRRTRLLGEVAHEMRTPLTALDGYVEGLIDGVFPASPDTFTSLSEELRRLHRLADDLSSLSRAQEQRVEVHPVQVDLADLARRAATRLSPQFDDADLSLTIHADTALPVRVDPDRITQILTNLLGNALLATPAGGTVTVTARQVDGHCEVAVTDTGAGLAAADLERIFERFYRVPGQPRRSPGSGIGLTIAREYAHAHGGDVAATSPGRGQGSTFTLTLPLDHAAQIAG
jgi:signal transduction histidine kinase